MQFSIPEFLDNSINADSPGVTFCLSSQKTLTFNGQVGVEIRMVCRTNFEGIHFEGPEDGSKWSLRCRRPPESLQNRLRPAENRSRRDRQVGGHVSKKHSLGRCCRCKILCPPQRLINENSTSAWIFDNGLFH